VKWEIFLLSSSLNSANLLLPVCYHISDYITPSVCSQWATSSCHLDFSSAFAAVRVTVLLYKPTGSLIIVSVALLHNQWLFFCVITQYLLDILWSAFWCSPRICPWAEFIYLFITLLCSSIIHSNYLFVYWHYQNCSFNKTCNWSHTYTIWYIFHLCLVCY
jgi:hypothetical protein